MVALPHPDDIILDMRSGKVRTEGPLSKEEKAEWDRRLARRADAQAEVSEFARQYRRARDPEKKQQWLDEWHFEQRIYDIINDALPERYKAKLHDRSYREGASREGQALKEFLGRRSRKRRRANDNEEHA